MNFQTNFYTFIHFSYGKSCNLTKKATNNQLKQKQFNDILIDSFIRIQNFIEVYLDNN